MTSLAQRLQQAERERQAGAVAAAAGLYESALNEAGFSAAIGYRLAECWLQLGKLAEAEALYQRVLATTPNAALAHLGLGFCAKLRGDIPAATEAFGRAWHCQPTSVISYMEWVNVLLPRADYATMTTATDELERLQAEGQVSLSPEQQCFVHNVAALLAWQAGDDVSIRRRLEAVFAISADDAMAHHTLASRAFEGGDIATAIQHFQRIPATAPHYPDALFALTMMKALPEISPIQHCLTRTNLNPLQRIKLQFAMGHVQQQCHDYAAAFSAFQDANRNLRRALPDTGRLRVATLQTLQQQAYVIDTSTEEPTLPRPLFIVGMPRSGTTLLTNMLCRHPAIETIGESSMIEDWVSEAHDSQAKRSTQDQQRYRNCYREAYAGFPASLDYIIDKMPFNFAYVGFIRWLFPEAVIIHCRRHPIATCFSCFTQCFYTPELRMTTLLEELADFYRAYAQMMEDWQQRGWLQQTVHYEDVVTDAKSVLIALLDILELPWHADCLNFQSHQGAVRTASSYQVRQPLYRDSLEQWRHYEAWLPDTLLAL